MYTCMYVGSTPVVQLYLSLTTVGVDEQSCIQLARRKEEGKEEKKKENEQTNSSLKGLEKCIHDIVLSASAA